MGGFKDNFEQATGGGGVTDHGALTGLADDDHTQYALSDGTRLQAVYSATPPTSPAVGQIWLDTTTGTPEWKAWVGGAWQAITAFPRGHNFFNSSFHPDIDTSSLVDGNLLVYDQALGKWKASTGNHDVLTNVRPADPASADATRNKHTSNAEMQKLAGLLSGLTQANLDRIAALPPAEAFNEYVRNTTQSITTATWTSVTFSGFAAPAGRAGAGMAGYRTSNSVTTIQRAGWYVLGIGGAWASNATGIRMSRIFVNGTTEYGAQRDGAPNGISEFANNGIQIWLDVGDTVEYQVYQSSGANLLLAIGVRGTISQMY